MKNLYQKARKWYSKLGFEKQIFFAVAATILFVGLVSAIF
jgi:hypothetical protein